MTGFLNRRLAKGRTHTQVFDDWPVIEANLHELCGLASIRACIRPARRGCLTHLAP